MIGNGVTISFDNSSREMIISALGLRKDGLFLIDMSGSVVKNSRGKKIKHSEFGGVLQGSKIFIRNDVDDVLEYVYNQI